MHQLFSLWTMVYGLWTIAIVSGSPVAASAPEPRTAKVAGAFYPAEPKALRAMVTELLAHASVVEGVTPRILISPHAGYDYSG